MPSTVTRARRVAATRRMRRAALVTALAVVLPVLPAAAGTVPAEVGTVVDVTGDAPAGVTVDELDLSGVDRSALASLPAAAPQPAEEAPATDPATGPATDPATDDAVARALTATPPPDSPDAALSPDAGDPDVLTGEMDTDPFTVLGVTWDRTPGLDDVVVRYRVREAGTWSAWAATGASDIAPDLGGRDAADGSTRDAIDPVVTADADGLQLWADAGSGTVTGLKAVLIDPGDDPVPAAGDPSAATEPLAAAVAEPNQPPIISRAGWGADESMVGCSPDYSTQMASAAIHHTASANGYTADAVPGILRGFLAYHTRPEANGGRGWCDIGYNFLVDRFGRIFEGRAGGVTSTVVGVHTGGFNSRTIGVSAIGEYGAAGVPQAMTDAIVSLLAWKLAIHGIVAGGTVSMVSGGGASKFPAGTVVEFATIYGHRDAQLTACPGQNLYALLPTIRARVAELANATVAVSPRGSWDSTTTTGTGFTVAGWAVDPETAAALTVEVRVDGVLSTVLADQPRPDIGALYPALGSAHGFQLTVPRPPGSSVVCLAARNVGEGTTVSLGCRRVTVRNAAPLGAVDAVTPSGTGVTISGWALDPDTSASNEVHVYVDGTGVALTADRSRPDIAAVFGLGDRHGFVHTRALARGDHTACVHSIDTAGGANSLLACRTFAVGPPVPRAAPIGVIDAVSVSNTALAVSGWALDPDTSDPVAVHVYVDGVGASLIADRPRPDVGAALGKGDRHGWTYVRDAAPGRHDLCVHAINTGAGANTLLGCRTVVVPDTRPIGAVDSVTTTNTSITVGGWTLDPDTSASTQAHVYVDGVGVALVADRSRPDVAAAFGRGDRHGFTHTVPASPGPHGVCVYGINTSLGAHTMLTCRTVVVPDAAPLGALDSVVVGPGTLTVAGWALDPDTTAPVQVHVYVDGAGISRPADLPRPDVAAAFGRGDRHGFSHTASVPRGERSVCVHAINTVAGPNTLLGCRTVRVP